MNKNIYRVIFNKARGVMMVVSEIVTVHSGVSRGVINKPESHIGMPGRFVKLQPLFVFTVLALGATVLVVPSVQADIITDANAPLHQQASVTNTANGVPQINITTPNAAGLSRNTFSRFDIDNQGAILNNARTITQTQLGGLILGNPNLATGTASVILNEVNSNNPSQLRGFLEVAGDSAQVIVANPAGITCDGCGFINANRATLTTGTPAFNGGNLEGYVVRRGVINIEGDGLNSNQTNFTDVIARAVKVNASIFATDLRVTTGANNVNVSNTTATPIVGEGDVPTLSIDVSELGGMYAGKIRLIGTEQGVGVRNAGSIGASAGSFTLTADGKIINTGQMTASIDIALNTSDDINNTGVIAASKTLSIKSDGTLTNIGTGALFGDDIDLDVDTLENREQDGTAAVIAARKQLDITLQTLTNRDGAILYSGGDITIDGDTLNNNSGIVDAGGDIDITANTINNTNEDFVTEQVQTSNEQVQEFALVGSPNRYRPNQVSLRPDRNDDVNFLVTPEGEDDAYNQFDYTRRITETRIVRSSPAQITAGGDIRITADTLINDNSRILAGGVLTADLENLINTETAGQRITAENGTLTTFTRRNRKGRDATRVRRSAYAPAAQLESTDLNQADFVGGANVAGSGTEVPLLNSALFRATPDLSATFLIETDPRFTNLREFLSSAFVLDQLLFDPSLSQKRLGDGFYEQQLVREQIAQLTGRRFLGGYVDEETQYRDLLNAGITAVQDFNLQPGIALTATQMAQLTSDVVLLIEQQVTLPNGNIAKVLVPQLYARPQQGDLTGNGGLLAAVTINLNLSGSLKNSATIAGRQLVTLNANTINNLGGRVTAPTSNITATNDINLHGGRFEAQDALTLIAGNNINAESALSTQTNAQGSRTNINRVASLFVEGGNGILVASAGQDLNLNGVKIVNRVENGSTQITAGNNINLGAITESLSQAIVHDGNNFRKEGRQDDVGSTITATGAVRLTAGNDINAKAANLSSEQAGVTLIAGKDIQLAEGRATRSLDEGVKNKSRGFLSSTIRTRRDKVQEDTSQGSVISAEQVTIQAGNDINLVASDVVATDSVTVTAQKQLNIKVGIDTRLELNLREKKKSGVFSSSGFGFTIGKQQLNTDTRNQVASAAASSVGSLEGNINLSAGGDFIQTGSRVTAAQGDITVTAKNITIESAQNTSKTVIETKFKQSGLSVSITNPVLSTLQTVKRVNTARKRVKDSRLKKLATTTKLLAIWNGEEAIEARLAKVARDAIDAGNGAAKDTNTGDSARDKAADTSTLADKVGGINISVSLGSSKRQSKSVQNSLTAASSTLSAGNNIILNATGEHEGIRAQGSQISAGNNVVLQAKKDIELIAARNISTLKSKNSSSSASIGASFGSSGPSLNASTSKGSGRSNGKDITFTNTRISAGNGIGLISGKDTILRGAVVQAEQVTANIGGSLTIVSLQEISTYKSKQKTKGLSLSVQLGGGIPSGSINTSQSKVDADFKSVTEQSAILTGDEGFQINVQGNTHLDGAITASTEQAELDGKNEFITGTLTTSNLDNEEEVTASQKGFSVSSGKIGKYKIAKALISNFATNTDLASDQQSTTLSSIGTNNFQITNDEQQRILTGESAETTIASINKDALTNKNSSNALTKTDAKQIEIELQATTTIKAEFSKQILTITDDAYKALFGRIPKFYKVTCPAGADCKKNPQRAITTLVTAEEVAENGSKETVIAVNGIFNSLERAGELAYQNAENIDQTDDNIDGRKPDTIYLLHYVPADGRIAEFLATGYENLLTKSDYETGKSLGYSNVDIAYAEVLRARGNSDTESLAHSRGTQVQANAFKILGNQIDAQGNTYKNDKLTVRSVGVATNIADLAESARALKVKGRNIRASVFDNDAVSAALAGVDKTASIGELLSSLFGTIFTPNSAHSCYGTGAKGCNQVEIPVRNGPELSKGADNSRLIRFENGRRKESVGFE